jgi:hypothetical protein
MEPSDIKNVQQDKFNSRVTGSNKLALGIVGAAAFVSPLLPANTTEAESLSLDATIAGPYCENGKNTFDYTVTNNLPSTNSIVDVKLNGLFVDNFYVNASSSYMGHLATGLTFGQPYRLEINSDDKLVGQPLEGIALDCEIKRVVPAEPSFNDISGSDKDTVTIPEVESIQYLMNGVAVGSGVHPASGYVKIIANAKEGYVIDPNAKSEWDFNFSEQVTDISNIPNFVPPIEPDSPAKTKKYPKKNRKTCTKITKVRDLSVTNPYSKKMRKITKKENKILKNKCNIKYPKIALSTPNTLISQKTPYNWGEKPFTMVKPNKPSLYIESVDEVIYKNGKVKYMNQRGGDYLDSNIDNYLEKNITQELPAKKRKNVSVDKIFSLVIGNHDSYFQKRGEDIVVTAGMRTIGKNSHVIAEDTKVVEDGNRELFILKDSKSTPPSNIEIEYDDNKTTLDEKNIIAPSDNRVDKIKRVVVYFAVRNYENDLYQYYQRSVLIGQPAKLYKKSGATNSKPSYDQQLRYIK